MAYSLKTRDQMPIAIWHFASTLRRLRRYNPAKMKIARTTSDNAHQRISVSKPLS